MVKDQRAGVLLFCWSVSFGWSSHPRLLHVSDRFSGSASIWVGHLDFVLKQSAVCALFWQVLIGHAPSEP